MKFKLASSAFQDALKKVSGVASSKNALQILGNVKIEAKDGKISFTTTNLDSTLYAQIPCADIEEGGETTVPMQKLEQVVSVMPVGVISVSVSEDNKATLVSGASRMSIGGLPAKDYPEIGAFEKDEMSCTIKVKALADVIRKTAYAASQDKTRAALMSVLFEFVGGKLNAVATDGRRLSMAEAEVIGDGERKVVVPQQFISLISRIKDDGGDAEIHADENRLMVSVEGGAHRLYTKIIAEQYPNYQQVIPKAHATEAEIDRADFVTALTRVSIMASSVTPSVKMDFGNGKVVIDVAGDDLCDAHEELPVKYAGEVISLALNPRYVLDVLKAADADSLHVEMTDGMRPIVVRSADEGFIGVIMPLRQT